MTAITAITAQNTCGVRSIHGVPAQMLREQIDAVIDDIGADAVKIGMLHAPEIVRTVAEAIDRHCLENVVFDPVMVATSGAVLIEPAAMEVLVRELFPRAALITPNLDEAALLVRRPLNTPQDMEQAALTLLEQGARAVLLKGGHLPGEQVMDLFVARSGEKVWMEAPRIHTRNTHGTGCTLASAVAAHLALGAPLLDAVENARAFVRSALQAGSQVRTGRCGGPLNHGHAPLAMWMKALAAVPD